jgi:hypothetical protein
VQAADFALAYVAFRFLRCPLDEFRAACERVSEACSVERIEAR